MTSTTVNFARFSINDSPSEDGEGNRGYDASANETLAIALERPELGVLSVIFEVVRSSLYESPLVFTETGERSVLLGGSGLPVDTVVHIEVPPTTDLSSYLLRATVTTVVGVFVWERLVAVVKGGIRLTVPFESTQYSQRGWSDSLNQVAKAIADGGAITPLVSDSNVGAALSFPAGLRRIFSSDGSQDGGRWDVLTKTDIDAALAIESIAGEKLADGAVTESKITSNAVTESKIASNAVTESKIASNTVTASKIASNAVTTAKVSDGAITLVKMANFPANTILTRSGSSTAGVPAATAIAQNSLLLRGSGNLAPLTVDEDRIIGRAVGGALGAFSPTAFNSIIVIEFDVNNWTNTNPVPIGQVVMSRGAWNQNSSTTWQVPSPGWYMIQSTILVRSSSSSDNHVPALRIERPGEVIARFTGVRYTASPADIQLTCLQTAFIPNTTANIRLYNASASIITPSSEPLHRQLTMMKVADP